MAKKRNRGSGTGSQNWHMIELGGGSFHRMKRIAEKSPKRFLVIDKDRLTSRAIVRRNKLKNVDFKRGDANAIMKSLPPNCTNIILAEHFMTVLDHAAREKAIAQARNAIKPGGRLICEHYSFLVPGLRKELEKAGFEIKSIVPVKSSKDYHEESVTRGMINTVTLVEKHGDPEHLQDNLNSLKTPFYNAAKTISDPKLKELLIQKLDSANTVNKFRDAMWPHKIIAINKK